MWGVGWRFYATSLGDVAGADQGQYADAFLAGSSTQARTLFALLNGVVFEPARQHDRL